MWGLFRNYTRFVLRGAFFAFLVSGILPATQAFADESESAKNSEISEKLLADTIFQVLQRQPQLSKVLSEAKIRRMTPWFIGGTAASISFYAKRMILKGKAIPDVVHFFDVFHPGQDVDLVFDNQIAEIGLLNGWISNQADLQIKLEGKSAWDFITLRKVGDRGFVGDQSLFLQNSDSISLGLFKVDDDQKTVEFRFATDFDDPSKRPNPFLEAVLSHKIDFYSRDTHRESEFFKKGMNPEIVSVMRVINKAIKYDLWIPDDDIKTMDAIVRDYLSSEQPNVGSSFEYVRGRLERIVREMLLGSHSYKKTVQLMQRFHVLKVLKKAHVSNQNLREVIALERNLIHLQRGLSLSSMKRVQIDWVKGLPEGAVIEGTSLFGGARPPVLVRPSLLRAQEEIFEIMRVYSTANESNAKQVADKLSSIAKSHMEKVKTGSVQSPIFYLSDKQTACSRDCRDYSIIGHLLFSAAGIPSHITSVKTFTKVILDIAGSPYLLNTHTGAAEKLPINYKPDYLQNVWVAENHDFDKPMPRPAIWHLVQMFKRNHPKVPNLDVLASLVKTFPNLEGDLLQILEVKITEGHLDYIFHAGEFKKMVSAGGAQLQARAIQKFNEYLSQPMSDSKLQAFQNALLISQSPKLMEVVEVVELIERLPLLLSDESFEKRNKLAKKILIGANEWEKPELRKSIFLILFQHIDLDKDLNGLSWSAIRYPSAAHLPIANAYHIRTKKYFFDSTANQNVYREQASRDVVLNLLEHDIAARALVGDSPGERAKNFEKLLAYLFSQASFYTAKKEDFYYFCSKALTLAAISDLSHWKLEDVPTLKKIIFESNFSDFSLMDSGIRSVLSAAPLIRQEVLERGKKSLDFLKFFNVSQVDAVLDSKIHNLTDSDVDILKSTFFKYITEKHQKDFLRNKIDAIYSTLIEFYKLRYRDDHHIKFYKDFILGRERFFGDFVNPFDLYKIMNSIVSNVDLVNQELKSQLPNSFLKLLKSYSQKNHLIFVKDITNSKNTFEANNLLKFFISRRGHNPELSPTLLETFKSIKLSTILRNLDGLVTPEENVSWLWLNHKTLGLFSKDDIKGLEREFVESILKEKQLDLLDGSMSKLVEFMMAFSSNPYFESQEFVQRFPKIVKRLQTFILNPGAEIKLRDFLLLKMLQQQPKAEKPLPNALVKEVFSSLVRANFAKSNSYSSMNFSSVRAREAFSTLYRAQTEALLGFSLNIEPSNVINTSSICNHYLKMLYLK